MNSATPASHSGNHWTHCPDCDDLLPCCSPDDYDEAYTVMKLQVRWAVQENVMMSHPARMQQCPTNQAAAVCRQS
jgi:hypothetical protein